MSIGTLKVLDAPISYDMIYIHFIYFFKENPDRIR